MEPLDLVHNSLPCHVSAAAQAWTISVSACWCFWTAASSPTQFDRSRIPGGSLERSHLSGGLASRVALEENQRLRRLSLAATRASMSAADFYQASSFSPAMVQAARSQWTGRPYKPAIAVSRSWPTVSANIVQGVTCRPNPRRRSLK
jgi:hypothetical protein